MNPENQQPQPIPEPTPQPEQPPQLNPALNIQDMANPALPRIEPAQVVTEPKKNTTLKVVLIIVIAIAALPLLIIVGIVIFIMILGSIHGSELSRLEKETVATFEKSSLQVSDYDCHDVELRNQCYFTISDSTAKVGTYLTNDGFTKNETRYSTSYTKGTLYIEESGDTSYTSYYKN
ncbi:MAG: hypothetical protein WAQ27_03690 [Candidatus Microsaccharimonas sp.]